MNTLRRKSRKTTIELETLDVRIAPATTSFAAAAFAAIAHQDVLHLDARHQRFEFVRHGRFHAGHQVKSLPLTPAPPQSSGELTIAEQSVLGTPRRPVWSAPPVAPIAVKLGPTPLPPIIVVQPTLPPSPVSVTAPTPSPAPAPAPAGGPTVTNPPPKLDSNLNTIYRQFVSNGSSENFTSPLASFIKIEGNNVGVDVHGNGGDFTALVSELQGLGMQITASDATTQTVEGMLPISQLPAAAVEPQTLSITAQYLPLTA
jgi:hypothetical protein